MFIWLYYSRAAAFTIRLALVVRCCTGYAKFVMVKPGGSNLSILPSRQYPVELFASHHTDGPHSLIGAARPGLCHDPPDVRS